MGGGRGWQKRPERRGCKGILLDGMPANGYKNSCGRGTHRMPAASAKSPSSGASSPRSSAGGRSHKGGSRSPTNAAASTSAARSHGPACRHAAIRTISASIVAASAFRSGRSCAAVRWQSAPGNRRCCGSCTAASAVPLCSWRGCGVREGATRLRWMRPAKWYSAGGTARRAARQVLRSSSMPSCVHPVHECTIACMIERSRPLPRRPRGRLHRALWDALAAGAHAIDGTSPGVNACRALSQCKGMWAFCKTMTATPTLSQGAL